MPKNLDLLPKTVIYCQNIPTSLITSPKNALDSTLVPTSTIRYLTRISLPTLSPKAPTLPSKPKVKYHYLRLPRM